MGVTNDDERYSIGLNHCNCVQFRVSLSYDQTSINIILIFTDGPELCGLVHRAPADPLSFVLCSPSSRPSPLIRPSLPPVNLVYMLEPVAYNDINRG